MKRGIEVTCKTCGRMKQPHGRSAGLMANYCGAFEIRGEQCPGYDEDPKPGCLWPGETDEDFGYPVCDNATEEVSNHTGVSA